MLKTLLISVFVLLVNLTHAQVVESSSIDTPARIRFNCAPRHISEKDAGLFIIDRKKISYDNLAINFFDPSNIENIKVYKPKDDSAKLYGQEARNGVVMIETTKAVNWQSLEKIFRNYDKNPFHFYRKTLFIVDGKSVEPGKEFYLDKEIIKSINFDDDTYEVYLNKIYKRTIAITTSLKSNG